MEDDFDRRAITHKGLEWEVTRQVGVWAGSVRPGDLIPFPPRPGLRFVASNGERRFLRIDYPELPKQEDFHKVPPAKLIEFLEKSSSETDMGT